MRAVSLLCLFLSSCLVMPARNDRGAIAGRAIAAGGVVHVVATNLSTGEKFSSSSDGAGEFTLDSLTPGYYRVVLQNEAGTAVARRSLRVRMGTTLRMDTRLEANRPVNMAGTRDSARLAIASTAPDSPPVIRQWSETSSNINAVVLVNDNTGWAVGDPHWDQNTRQFTGTIIKTADGGVTWNHQDAGVTDALNGVCFVNASQGWAVGDNGTILRTTDGGSHWTRQTVATTDSFRSVAFTDASNGWATSDRATRYSEASGDFVGWEAAIWHTSDGGQTWARQTIPASVNLLKRIVFVNANVGFAAGLKQTGFDVFGDPESRGAIYGTTDGGRTWKEVYVTASGLTFTALYFTDASNGWASGFPHSSSNSDACTYRTSDGGKTWQPQELGSFNAQVRDLHMLDNNRGYAAGTAYVGDGTAVWRTLDGGTTWKSVRMENTNPITVEGYWGLAMTANRVLIMGDRDATARSTRPWDACSEDSFTCGSDCSCLFTQAYISPHYIFHDVFFTDSNRGWAVGSRSFSPQLWGQVILATRDGGQTWTTQFERSVPDGLFSYHRLESVSFADANNGWAAGSSEWYATTGTSAALGCILHTTDGGVTWTDQARDVCAMSGGGEFSAIQFLDAQNGWALSTSTSLTGKVQLAHTTDGGNHWTLVDTGIAGEIAVGFAFVQGGMRFADALHGCFAGWDVVGCTSDGGAHWTKAAVDCGSSLCYLDANAVAFADALHGWIGGGDMYRTADGGAHWSKDTSKPSRGAAIQGVQFSNSSKGWFAGNYGVLFQTTDAGAHWQAVSSGTGIDLLGLSFPNEQRGWIVGEFGTILSYAGDRTASGKPAVFAAVNAASYGSVTAPAAWISIFGANLSSVTRSWAQGDFAGNKLPTSLDGVSVTVNGKPAYLSYISPGQINAMFPDDGATGQVTVQVTNAQGSSGTLPVQKSEYSPALFRLSARQGNYVVAQTTDGKLVGNYMVGWDLGIPSQVRDAMPGEIVTLYGTGFGPTNPALPSDTLVSVPAPLAAPVTFRVGEAVAEVKWAGMIGPGLYQFNIQVPAVTGGDLVIVAEIAGHRSQSDSVLSVSKY